MSFEKIFSWKYRRSAVQAIVFYLIYTAFYYCILLALGIFAGLCTNAFNFSDPNLILSALHKYLPYFGATLAVGLLALILKYKVIPGGYAVFLMALITVILTRNFWFLAMLIPAYATTLPERA